MHCHLLVLHLAGTSRMRKPLVLAVNEQLADNRCDFLANQIGFCVTSYPSSAVDLVHGSQLPFCLVSFAFPCTGIYLKGGAGAVSTAGCCIVCSMIVRDVATGRAKVYSVFEGR
jgi:hypothetical protein